MAANMLKTSLLELQKEVSSIITSLESSSTSRYSSTVNLVDAALVLVQQVRDAVVDKGKTALLSDTDSSSSRSDTDDTMLVPSTDMSSTGSICRRGNANTVTAENPGCTSIGRSSSSLDPCKSENQNDRHRQTSGLEHNNCGDGDSDKTLDPVDDDDIDDLDGYVWDDNGGEFSKNSKEFETHKDETTPEADHTVGREEDDVYDGDEVRNLQVYFRILKRVLNPRKQSLLLE